MSFSWANKLAKSALLSAQKRIDSVLEIERDDDDEEEDEEEELDDEEHNTQVIEQKDEHVDEAGDAEKVDFLKLNLNPITNFFFVTFSVFFAQNLNF